VRPNGVVEFMTRASNGGNTSFVAGATASFPVWLRLKRKGATVTGLISSDAASWQTVGSVTLDSSWTQLSLAGLVVNSHDRSSTATATFQEPSVGLPWPWTHTDVGTVARADANAELIHSQYVVSGTGADIWGSADAFHYMYQARALDSVVVAQVTSEEDTSPYAKAGVMIRQNTNADAPHVILDVRPNGAVEFMTRSAAGGSTSYIAGVTRRFPVWLELEKNGSTITGSTSTDGSTWIPVGSIDVAWPGPLYGVAVTSHDTSLLNTAAFGTVYAQNASDASGPPPSPKDIVIYARDVAAGAMHGVWASASDPTAAGGTKLTTPPGSAPNTSAPLASPQDYVDIPFTTVANTTYTLWIRVKAANNSKYSDSLWVQFSDAQANGGGAFPIGTTSGLLLNLATDSNASSINDWGWVDGAYWMTQPATFTFSTTDHTLRVQPREYGVQIDQIVLSPSTYLNRNASCPTSCASAPGGVTNDTTIVPKP